MIKTAKTLDRMNMPEPKAGDLAVWHIPQIPMNPFWVPVSSPEEANKVLNILAEYDLFQLENHIKPDYSNAQGLDQYFVYTEKEHADKLPDGWETWYSDEGEELDEYIERIASTNQDREAGTTLEVGTESSCLH